MNSKANEGIERQHRFVAGIQIVDAAERVLGKLTAVKREDGRLRGTINDEYDVDLSGSVEILDLTGQARAQNPALEAAYVRLAQ
ncbi:hypothetical protein [Burkholderia sp. Ac-20365]|uniref:hypothetical protein n=1 Tax=Burkholderia sp. Ac-20365 TaxID=2703897 RepID=UPI00197C8A86|nr:hypothetical protein [Burkholderia sp. Ac-20365]MBN3761034.1 hypothetical protein [Burkholderia sp. Ac-20365]